MAIQGRQEIGNVTINIGNPSPQTQNVGSPLTTDANDRKPVSNYDAYDGLSESGLVGYQQGDIINYAPIINNTYIVSSGATIIETGGGSFNGLLSGTGVIEFSGRSKIFSNSNGSLSITNNAQNSGAILNVRSVILDTNDLYNSSSWNDNLSVPTKDAVREQIESMVSNIDNANNNANNAIASGNLAITRVNSLSGSLNTISGNLNSLSGYVMTISGNATQSNLNTLSGHLLTVSGTLNTNVAYTNLIANNLNIVSGLATNLSGHVVTISGTVNSQAGSLSNLSGTTSLLTTNFNTISGRLNTLSGHLVTVSGITVNNTASINTLSGNLITVSGLIGPNTSGAFTSLSGSLVTVSGTVQTNQTYMNLIADNLNLCSGRVDVLSGIIRSGDTINVMDSPWNLIPANKDSSQAAATYNTLQLNRLFNSASGLQDTPLTVYFPGRSFLINDSIILPPKASFCVKGNGFLSTVESGLSIFNAPWSGSTASKLVWVGPNDKPMVINYAPGTKWEVPLVGYYADSNAKHLAATVSENIAPSVLTGFAQIGMLIPNQTSGIACGKIAFPTMTTVFCQTGVCFGSGALTGHNADESWFGYFYPQFCGVGIATRTQNAQLFTMGAFTPYACNTGFFISGGGNVTVQHLLAIASGGVLFEVGNTSVNTPLVHIGMLSIDNGFKNGRVLKMSPSPDLPKPLNFTIESMFMGNAVTGGNPLFELRDAAMLGINAGFGIQEGIIRFINTTSPFTPTASLYRMRMAHTPSAASPTGFVHSTSTGTGIITHRDAQTYYGSYFNSNRYSWGNGVQTNMTGF